MAFKKKIVWYGIIIFFLLETLTFDQNMQLFQKF